MYMSIEKRTWETMDTYLEGGLSNEEHREFNQRLQTDVNLKEEYDFIMNFKSVSRYKSNRELKQFLKAKENAKTKVVEMPRKRHFTWRRIAAALILTFGAFQFFYNTQSTNNVEHLYAELFTPYPNVVQIVERGSTGQDGLSEVFSNYAKGDYQAVLHSIESVNSNETSKQTLLFYKAISLMALERNSEADEILGNLKASGLTGYDNQINWYLALNAIKANDKENAIVHLNKIMTSGESYRKASAENLLQTLKK